MSAVAAGIAASALLAPLVDGPTRLLQIAHRGPHALQLVDDEGRAACCVINRSAIRLPHAAVVPSFPRGSSPVSVGDGSLGWDGSRIPVVRWWRPARPRLPRLSRRIDETTVRRFLDRQLSLVGRGDGLTPFEDDVLCGAMVTLAAAGHRAVAPVRAVLQTTDLEARTTATSAALLRLAADGYCVDALSDYLTALATGPGQAPRSSRLAVAAVGHTSGRGLLTGIDAVLSFPADAAA